MRIINDAGLKLLKQWEQGPHGGPALTPYDAGDGKQTIGYGHVIKQGEDYTAISSEKADALLLEDIEFAEDAVCGAIKVPLTDNQFAALVCWTFNVGIGAMLTSTLRSRLNDGHYDEVPAQLARWNKLRGRECTGLTNRRAAEIKLWNTP